MTATRGSATTLGDVASAIGQRWSAPPAVAAASPGPCSVTKIIGQAAPAAATPRRRAGCRERLDEVHTPVCPGNKAVVQLTVTKFSSYTPRTISVKATDPGGRRRACERLAGRARRATIVLSYEVPTTSAEGDERRAIVWVRGCRDYVLPWTVETSCSNADCCREVAIDDCPTWCTTRMTTSTANEAAGTSADERRASELPGCS